MLQVRTSSHSVRGCFAEHHARQHTAFFTLMNPSSRQGLPLVLCLCQQEDHWKLIPGYAEAFRRQGYEMFCVGGQTGLDAPLSEILEVCPSPPVAVLHFESALPLLPEGLTRSVAPTVC